MNKLHNKFNVPKYIHNMYMLYYYFILILKQLFTAPPPLFFHFSYHYSKINTIFIK